MTTIGIDLHSMTPGSDGLRRDRWGRLLVVPPTGGKAEGYTRVTTVAKALDEGGGLAPWKAAMALTGMARRPGLAARWEALMAAHRDPWYSDPETKAKVKALVEEAAQAGGATDRRDQGDALHAITAQVDAGTTPHLLGLETARDVAVYRSTLERHGIEVVELEPGRPAIETTVVLDGPKVAGTFDRLVRVRGYERPLIADLKTGADLKYSGGAFAVQLAAYAHHDALYHQGADPTGRQDVREARLEVDQEVGLIIHLPAGEGRCEVYTVDLEAGWEAFALSLAARAWRTRKDLMAPLSSWVAEVTPPEPVKGKVVAHLLPLGLEREVVDVTPAEDLSEVRTWLQGRIDAIGAVPVARADLGASWAALGVPTLKTSTAHTLEQLERIEACLDAVEARHSIPFGPPKPGHTDEARRRLLATFPGSTVELGP